MAPHNWVWLEYMRKNKISVENVRPPGSHWTPAEKKLIVNMVKR